MAEPKTLFKNKTNYLSCHLIWQIFQILQNLFANANDLHDTNIEIFRGNVKYVTYTTQLEAKLIF